MNVTNKSILDYVVDAYQNGMISALITGIIIGVAITWCYYKFIHNKNLNNKLEFLKKELDDANNRAEKSKQDFDELNKEVKKYQSDFYASRATKQDSYDSLLVKETKL